MRFLRIFKHLLPDARAWDLTFNKQLRQFIQGLAVGIGDITKVFIDKVFLDRFPATTRELGKWEFELGITGAALSDSERRARLDARWKATGGQSLEYIQGVLQGAGFDVFLHTWYDPATVPPPGDASSVAPRDPRIYIRGEFTNLALFWTTSSGEVLMEAGEVFAESGNSTDPVGYPLVNIDVQTGAAFTVLAGEALAEAGELTAEAGNYNGFRGVPVNYIVPDDPLTWPFFLYIGGETFPDVASIPVVRKDEFEALCLKICPTQQWLAIMVQYF